MEILSATLLSLSLFALLSSGQEGPWLAVRDEGDSWLYFVEASARKEFWFRPQPTLASVWKSSDSSGRERVRVLIDLWSSPTLRRARNVLLARGRCDSNRSCSVLPFLVDRVGLRDQQGEWQASVRWRFVTGAIPRQLLFDFHRAGPDAGEATANCSGWREAGLSEMTEKAREGALVLEMMPLRALAARPPSRRILSFSVGDVLWAVKTLGIPITGNFVTIDQRLLNRLARALLTTKLQALENEGTMLPLVATPVILSRIRTALSSRVTVGSNNRTMVLLKQWSKLHRFEIPVVADTRLGITRMSVSSVDLERKVPEQQTTSASPDPTNAPLSDTTDPVKTDKAVEKLQLQVAELERKIANIVGRTSSRAQGKSQRPSRLTSLDDCSQVITRRLPAGIYHLKPAARRVRCTADGRLVALSRTTGDVDFNKGWRAYRDGFGDPNVGDYWVGLRFLADYTSKGDRCMELEMQPWKISTTARVARYATVAIAAEQEKFRLSYGAFNGTVAKDALKGMNGQPFSTHDRDNDAFLGNCAASFAGGNWYKSCSHAHIFGIHKYVSGPATNTKREERNQLGPGMCWEGLVEGHGSSCLPLLSLKMIFSRVKEHGTGRGVFLQEFAPPAFNCTSIMKWLTINVTGLYHITAGGGSGGTSSRKTPGGRGALVGGQIFLKQGAGLVIVVGCGGGRGSHSGHGGNATMVMESGSWRPIIVAGGGGGSSSGTPGAHGQADENGGLAWWVQDKADFFNSSFFLRPASYRGRSWDSCRKNTSTCTTGHLSLMQRMIERLSLYGNKVISYVSINADVTGGGGGGGYEGGVSGTHLGAAGGGGGSFCDLQLIPNCRKEGGGNRHQVGFVILEKKLCF